MNQTNPLVTIYMPTHNRRHFLERALKSLVTQTYENIEIIVVDDGSSDDTENFMKEFMLRYSNVKYFKHDTPKGANVARNYAIRESEGEFLTGMDDDDEMLPARIEELLKAYDDQYAYVFSLPNHIDDNGQCSVGNLKKKTITLDDMLYSNITENQVFTTKAMFYEAGLFDEDLDAAQDYDMWIRMLKIKPIAKRVNLPLYNMYVHTEGRITTSSKKAKGYWQCYVKHKNLMNTSQRKINLLKLRYKDRGENISDLKYRYYYDYMRWPRLLATHYKYRLIELKRSMQKAYAKLRK